MDHHHHYHQQLPAGRKPAPVSSPETALASEAFDQFCNASTLKSILVHFRQLCDLLRIKPNTINQFYPKLKAKLRSWKAQALWKKFDQRANHKCYNRGKACSATRVLIIGGGPCGLRSAIEAQLLGAKVVVVEKRDRMSRNNVLHLWPFVIQDLRGLGAKKFFGKFCAGSIDHISIRQLQCILLKVALILGVEFHESVSFDSLISPPDNQEDGKIGWRARTTPADHPVSQYEFDVLIGADGKRNTLEGFKRKEFRGKLAIAITANFINRRTEAEARVEEISGVAFIFNQKFFKELYRETGIDLENIVYYKDDTHYFVMTAKKHSLIDKGVILQDHADTAKLLAKENVDREALMLYAREAAEFSTEYQMMDMEFAVNHYGQPDVAMFDFTSMYAAENASRVLERHGHRLLMILVGDSLLEPFWPTGSGCARGFLSSLDACWAIKAWGGTVSPLDVIAERESIYRLLGQTTPENLNRDYAAYTLDPHTRYPNLNIRSVTAIQVRGLLDTDDPESAKQATVHSAEADIPKKRRRRELRADAQVHPDTLLRWLQRQVALYDNLRIEDMGASFKNGLALCAIIHRYRPDLIDFHNLEPNDVARNNQLAFDILEKELGIAPIMTGEEMLSCDVPDKLAMFSYLTQIYEVFRGEIPHIRHPKVDLEDEDGPTARTKQLSQLTPEQKAQFIGRMVAKQEGTMRGRHSRSRHAAENLPPHSEKKGGDTINRRSRKRRSTEKMGATVEDRMKRLDEIEKNRAERMRKRQYLRKMATQQFYKSMQMLQANAKREKDEPFEDYSIFLYRQTAPDFKDRVKDLEQKILHPDREAKMHAGHYRGGIDDEFSGRIKSIEDKLKGSAPSEKKPRDLLRAIGKIEKTDWNVKEIEKKIEENKMGRGVRHDRVERVPKWSREQFLARQIKMEKKGHDQRETDSKYADIDSTLKSIDKKIKEGNVLGHNKVSAMAEQFSNKNQHAEPKVQKTSNAKANLVLPAQGGSETCHFCNKRVYLMERLSAEGKFFHRGCFRCEYCSISLRIGNHTFDREKNGGRFYCAQHFGLSGTMKARGEKKRIQIPNKENIPGVPLAVKTPEKSKIALEGVVGLDLLDRGQTPERIEFENLAGMSDAEEAHSQMDEDEWTDRNFGASTAEMGSSDDISDMSDSDDDNEVYEEAIDQPLTTEGTLELAKNWTLRYSHSHAATGQSDTGSNEYEDSSDEYTSEDDESGTATEDEDDVRARELRRQEVWLKVPPRSSDTDTGSETEVASDDRSTEESDENSATEISTDSEFEHDGATPTQHEIPEITINDAFVRKTRGTYAEPKKVQVRSKVISSVNGNLKENTRESGRTRGEVAARPSPLSKEVVREVEKENSNTTKTTTITATATTTTTTTTTATTPLKRVPLSNPRKGDYLLNRTHSTEGIASKLSLELKKRYLLGGPSLAGTVVKSGSTSNVDTKLRNFTDSISQHQKLLNPAPEPSPTMQAFLQGTNKLRTNNTQLSPLSPTALLSGAKPAPSTPSFFDRTNARTDLANNGLIRKSPLLTGLPELSKIQLPDVVQLPSKEPPSVLKSRTAPNIVCNESKEEASSVPSCDIEPILTNDGPANDVTVHEIEIDQQRENENHAEDIRPRSPLHETSIIVPQVVDWGRKGDENKEDEEQEDEEEEEEDGNSSGLSEIDSDSLSSSDGEYPEADRNEDHQFVASKLSAPRLRIHNAEGGLLLDEGGLPGKSEESVIFEDGCNFEPDSIECSALVRGAQFPNERTSLAGAFADREESRRRASVPGAEIEAVNDNLEQLELHDKKRSNCSSPTASLASVVSGTKQDDSEENDVTTAALTETEFSEWAREGEALVSDDLRDAEFDIDSKFITTRRKATTQKQRSSDDPSVFELYRDQRRNFPTNDTSLLLVNGENIDYMDTTDNESLLDDSLREASNTALLRNRGYIEFVNVKTSASGGGTIGAGTRNNAAFADAPIAKLELENYSDEESLKESLKDANVIEINPITMDDVMSKLNGAPFSTLPIASDSKSKTPTRLVTASFDTGHFDGAHFDSTHFDPTPGKSEPFLSMDEDSLLIVEPSEDTTTSEVITILASPVNPPTTSLLSLKGDLPRDEKMMSITTQEAESPKLHAADNTNPDYLEYVKRLQSRIAEFSNAKDSIDVRKSKRKNSKSSSLHARTADMIAEEIRHQEATAFNSPATSRKLEEITRERSKQKNVIQDLLMDKLEAHKQKSAEKRAKRAARASSFTSSSSALSPVKIQPSASPSSSATTNAYTGLNRFVPTSIKSAGDSPNRTTFAEAKRALEFDLGQQVTDTSVTNVDPNKSSVGHETVGELRQSCEKTKDSTASPTAASPTAASPTADIDKLVLITCDRMTNQVPSTISGQNPLEPFKTPVAPPRLKHEEAKRTAEKARQDARERARLKSDEDLGLSPEDRIKELRMKVARRQALSMEEKTTRDDHQQVKAERRVRPCSFTMSISPTETKLRTSKSTDNMRGIAKKMSFEITPTSSAKSMDELSQAASGTTKFDEGSPGLVNKREKKKGKDPERRRSIIQAVSDFFFKKESMFRLSPKSKGKLDKLSSPKLMTRPKSVCEDVLSRNFAHESLASTGASPPIAYTMPATQVSADDSLSDDDTRATALSTSCMQKTTITEGGSCNSIPRKSKTAKKLARQAQLKRLRMAQEIQRKLEETEVKQRELENRGVSVEKALRGEGECSDRQEADLLREWFDLMKESTELRRFEKELLVRAQEVQLEDRHDRLQQELRERLADDDDKKSSADVQKEGEILTEMLEIVAKRDSLIALLEEERQRYQDEDRDLEAQMLAKGLRLTPIKKCDPKYSS